MNNTLLQKNNKTLDIPENPYLLLTPGPLSTTKTVKAAMLKDWCTWDDDYNTLVQDLRSKLLKLAELNGKEYTTVLMQGSGTFSVEAVIGTAVPKNGKLLVITNGAYGDRIVKMAKMLNINTVVCSSDETMPPDLNEIEETLKRDKDITHAAVVHVETTTGIENPVKSISKIIKKYDKVFILDAMSSFGGIPINVKELKIDFLISSANKCIQGVPGFGFIIAKTSELLKCKNNARSLSLDIYSQWETMESKNGKWRYTSPTHVVRAFYQALTELEEEGGITARYNRYTQNRITLTQGMKRLGFKSVIAEKYQSPIITTFYSPDNVNYNFNIFYGKIKSKGFVIYPGKVTKLDTFRIGSIGNVYPEDMKRLAGVISESIFWE